MDMKPFMHRQLCLSNSLTGSSCFSHSHLYKPGLHLPSNNTQTNKHAYLDEVGGLDLDRTAVSVSL
jgi:hypothetical protein